MLYILLGIIAVGVLLASEEGKGLLSLIFSLAVIAGILYLGFWGVMLLIAFYQSHSGQALFSSVGNIMSFLGGVILWLIYISFAALLLFQIWEKRKRIPHLLKEEFWGRRKGWVMTMAVLFLIVLGFVIMAIFRTALQ